MRVHDVGRAAVARGSHQSLSDRTTELTIPTELAALTLFTPLLAVALLASHLPHETGFTVLAGCSVVQLTLTALVLRHLRATSADHAGVHAGVRLDDLESTGLEELGLEHLGLEQAGLGVARDQDRLHEVRATVAGIGMTHRLLRDDDDRMSGSARARLEDLYDREIGRLERLLDTGVRPDTETVGLEAALDPVVEALRLQGLSITWDGTDASVIGRGDDVSEIVHVLLANSARHAPGSHAEVSVESTSTQVWVRVRDDGPGVPRSMAATLFDRGVRSPQSPGEGIGLDIARRLARELGGDLVLDERPAACGASFTVTLRAAHEPVPCLTQPS